MNSKKRLPRSRTHAVVSRSLFSRQWSIRKFGYFICDYSGRSLLRSIGNDYEFLYLYILNLNLYIFSSYCINLSSLRSEGRQEYLSTQTLF